jgi:hypothetical protein
VEFLDEARAIAVGRGSESDACYIGALKEQSQKWRAFANQLPNFGIKPDGFYNAVVWATRSNPEGEAILREYERLGFTR